MAFYSRYNGDEVFDEKQLADRATAFKIAFYTAVIMALIVMPALCLFIPIDIFTVCYLIAIVPMIVFVIVATWKNALNGRGEKPAADIFKYLGILGVVLVFFLTVWLITGELTLVENGKTTIVFKSYVIGIGSIAVWINSVIKRFADKIKAKAEPEE